MGGAGGKEVKGRIVKHKTNVCRGRGLLERGWGLPALPAISGPYQDPGRREQLRWQVGQDHGETRDTGTR